MICKYTHSGVGKFTVICSQVDADEPVGRVDYGQLDHRPDARFQPDHFPVQPDLGHELERDVVDFELGQRRVVVRFDQVVLAALQCEININKLFSSEKVQ